MQQKTNQPIGVFDSGVGGLTVLKQLKITLPHESFIYLGDTARLPYGTKSFDTIINYTRRAISYLVSRKVKLVVIACNTASAIALSEVMRSSPVPIIGVLEPGARAAAAIPSEGSILVLATESTVSAGGYQKLLAQLKPGIPILTQSCGVFVALAEEGWSETDAAKVAAHQYLAPFLSNTDYKICCLLLGCTHFPLLLPAIRSVVGKELSIVDSASVTAKTVLHTLKSMGLLTKNVSPTTEFIVTDLPQRFTRIARHFLQIPFDTQTVTQIDFS